MTLRNLRIKKFYGHWRLVEWYPNDNIPNWGNWRIIWPKVAKSVRSEVKVEKDE